MNLIKLSVLILALAFSFQATSSDSYDDTEQEYAQEPTPEATPSDQENVPEENYNDSYDEPEKETSDQSIEGDSSSREERDCSDPEVDCYEE